jgi:hypothetical protein
MARTQHGRLFVQVISFCLSGNQVKDLLDCEYPSERAINKHSTNKRANAVTSGIQKEKDGNLPIIIVE